MEPTYIILWIKIYVTLCIFTNDIVKFDTYVIVNFEPFSK